jgi:hypothetical protein
MDRRAMAAHKMHAKPAHEPVKPSAVPNAKEPTLRIVLKPKNIDGLQAALIV